MAAASPHQIGAERDAQPDGEEEKRRHRPE
jgi:hypothetical protein